MINYIEIGQQLQGYQWLLFSLVLNLSLVLFSIVFHVLLEKTISKPPLQPDSHPLQLKDVYTVLTTVICNALILLLGAFLWKQQWLVLGHTNSIVTVAIEVVVLVLAMDLLMYFFHYIAHNPFFYHRIHQKHHEHESTNCLSLFVLHPLESLGFGLILVVLLLLYPFSIYSIAVYLFINVLWGTIGHLNREFFPSKSKNIAIGTSEFHNQHHQHQDKNFGFYSSIWDRIFKTYR